MMCSLEVTVSSRQVEYMKAKAFSFVNTENFYLMTA